MQCNIVEYISYNMGNRDLPDIYTLALGFRCIYAALGLRCIYQANPSCPCYNLYIYICRVYYIRRYIAIHTTMLILNIGVTDLANDTLIISHSSDHKS